MLGRDAKGKHRMEPSELIWAEAGKNWGAGDIREGVLERISAGHLLLRKGLGRVQRLHAPWPPCSLAEAF